MQQTVFSFVFPHTSKFSPSSTETICKSGPWPLLEKNLSFLPLSIQNLAQQEQDPWTVFWRGLCSEHLNTLILFVSHKEERLWDTSVGVIYLWRSLTGILQEHRGLCHGKDEHCVPADSEELRTNTNQSLFGALELLASVTTATSSELFQIKKEGSSLFFCTCLGG